MKPIKDVLPNSLTVNSKDKSYLTVNSLSEKISRLVEEENITPEGVAMTLCDDLDDGKSYDYFFLLAQNNPYSRLLEASSLTKEAYSNGKIRKTKALYFMAILKNWGIKTKYKENDK